MSPAIDKLPQHEKKRKKPTNLTGKSVKELRDAGFLCCNVEKWIPQTKQRKDAFGFGDLLAVQPGQSGAILIQVCSIDDAAKRVRKITTECAEEARKWLDGGNRIFVHDWAKQGKAGDRKLWRLRETQVTLADLDAPVPSPAPC